MLGCSTAFVACGEKPPGAVVPKPATPAGNAVSAGPVFRLYFAGLDKLATDTNTAKLNALLNNAEAVATRKQVHDRLALVLPDVLFGSGSARTNRSALVRPLLDDLAASKFLFETHDDHAATWMLTVFLTAERRARWNTNLWQAAESGGGPAALARRFESAPECGLAAALGQRHGERRNPPQRGHFEVCQRGALEAGSLPTADQFRARSADQFHGGAGLW
ncbi:MAG: hypothetical protein EBS05_07590 [Proteobacteria bacterium]|nr:hypothetical protein [Pseudomonadota bacterium]